MKIVRKVILKRKNEGGTGLRISVERNFVFFLLGFKHHLTVLLP